MNIKELIVILEQLPKEAKCVDVAEGDITVEYHEDTNEVQFK